MYSMSNVFENQFSNTNTFFIPLGVVLRCCWCVILSTKHVLEQVFRAEHVLDASYYDRVCDRIEIMRHPNGAEKRHS